MVGMYRILVSSGLAKNGLCSCPQEHGLFLGGSGSCACSGHRVPRHRHRKPVLRRRRRRPLAVRLRHTQGPAAVIGLVRHAQGQRRLQRFNPRHERAVGIAGAPHGAGGHHRWLSLAGSGLEMGMRWLLEKIHFGLQTFLLYATFFFGDLISFNHELDYNRCAILAQGN